jgi:hypothetical protein
MKKTAITELKSVWGRVALGSAPAADEAKDTLGVLGKRAKSDRTAQLNLRIRPAEKQQIALMALRENVSINEMFSRMLLHYQREHGRVELSTSNEGSDG